MSTRRAQWRHDHRYPGRCGDQWQVFGRKRPESVPFASGNVGCAAFTDAASTARLPRSFHPPSVEVRVVTGGLCVPPVTSVAATRRRAMSSVKGRTVVSCRSGRTDAENHLRSTHRRVYSRRCACRRTSSRKRSVSPRRCSGTRMARVSQSTAAGIAARVVPSSATSSRVA